MTSKTGYWLLEDWRHVGVVDPCGYGRLGLVTALRSLSRVNPEPRHVQGYDSVQAALAPPWGGQSDEGLALGVTEKPWDALMVHLPKNPLDGLVLLLQLGALSDAALSPIPLIVLTDLSPGEVQRVLRRTGVGNPLRVMDDRLPVAALCLAPGEPGKCRGEGEPLPSGYQSRLTEQERLVLMSSLQGVTVQEQAHQRALNTGTVYGLRRSALHRLGAGTLPGLLARFCSNRPALPPGVTVGNSRQPVRQGAAVRAKDE